MGIAHRVAAQPFGIISSLSQVVQYGTKRVVVPFDQSFFAALEVVQRPLAPFWGQGTSGGAGAGDEGSDGAARRGLSAGSKWPASGGAVRTAKAERRGAEHNASCRLA